MRIRKNAKISAILYTNSKFSNEADESLLQKNLCQLNQSPWDIITFPSSDSSSSLHQFDDYDVYYNVNVNLARNGSSADSIDDVESVEMKKSPEDENDNDNDTDNNYGERLGFKEENQEIEEIVLCGKLDEKGWQCGRVVKNGNTMCDHHLSKLQNCAVWTTKKKSRPVSGPTTVARPHRTKKLPTTNPHDFYYYSGFGPSWGKKRGGTGTGTDTVTTTTTDIIEEATNIASNSNNGYETMDVNDVKEKPEHLEVGSMKMKLDYIDEGKKGKKQIIGKKRGRKPIKARSLKSLM